MSGASFVALWLFFNHFNVSSFSPDTPIGDCMVARSVWCCTHTSPSAFSFFIFSALYLFLRAFLFLSSLHGLLKSTYLQVLFMYCAHCLEALIVHYLMSPNGTLVYFPFFNLRAFPLIQLSVLATMPDDAMTPPTMPQNRTSRWLKLFGSS